MSESREKHITNIEDLVEEPKSEEEFNPDETQSVMPLTQAQIEMIGQRAVEKGISEEQAIKELKQEGAFQTWPSDQMVQELNEELEEDGVAA